MKLRRRRVSLSDIAEIRLKDPGDLLFLYSDGVYDGTDPEVRPKLEMVLREHYLKSAKDICNALLNYAVQADEQLRESDESDRIDDKTVFIIKRNT